MDGVIAQLDTFSVLVVSFGIAVMGHLNKAGLSKLSAI